MSGSLHQLLSYVKYYITNVALHKFQNHEVIVQSTCWYVYKKVSENSTINIAAKLNLPRFSLKNTFSANLNNGR